MNEASTYGYIALYKAQRYELHAPSKYDAWKQAVAHFKVKSNKAHLVTVHLAEVDGETVTQVITS
jgi:hypothetical protein